jgi:carbonic anhydrase/acetyltransferase-like protein (isoleucine patch superfamily)
MKEIIKSIFAFFNKLYFLISQRNITISGNRFYIARAFIKPNNSVNLYKTNIEKTRIVVSGSLNEIQTNHAFISNSSININGHNNKLIIEKDVKLRNATIHIRGNDCTIKIGKGTSTGGIRMVNVGNNNKIEIGENCLFADFIEIWASDTHSILNEYDEIINPEKPIFIGDKVWVGSHVIILKGVTIQHDSVIGMGSIVSKDVPPGVVSVGYPNRIIKENITWKLDY